VIRDLHTHTNVSDGSLSPIDLLRLAETHDVDFLSITDHDTVKAYEGLQELNDTSVELIPGIELSTTWQSNGIHVVGLNIDPANPELSSGVDRQQQARVERARKISDRLTRLGIDNPYEAVKSLAGEAGIGRPHFAQHLVNIGKVSDLQAAFRKYLGAGKMGDVRQGWASMPDVVEWIVAAGGVAVLAHPAKYKFTNTKLRVLLEDFKDFGGRAVEVVSGHQEPSLTKRLGEMAAEFGLLASTGSDFHHPVNKWSRPGGFSALPDQLETVWDAW
jgi:3',5'-nucleoside bisphosphate phosphatase